MDNIFRTIALCAVLLGSTFSAQVEKRVALAIGNDRYAVLPSLQKVANDAAAVGDTLSKLRFDVVRGPDLGRQAMIDKLAEFMSKVEAGDTPLELTSSHPIVSLNCLGVLVFRSVLAGHTGPNA